jgi:hypothetical protein
MKKKRKLLLYRVVPVAIVLLAWVLCTMVDENPPEPSNIQEEPTRSPAAETPEANVEPNFNKTQKLTKQISEHFPTRAPAALNGRWSQVKSAEDNEYLSTQLNFDDKPVDHYFYRWKKGADGQPNELVGGILPTIASVSGAFPSIEQSHRLAEEVVSNEGSVISLKEVWFLNSERILVPELKVEVQVKNRSEKNAGHEWWYINANSGKIVKRTDADRF